jgi:hypothetical protein
VQLFNELTTDEEMLSDSALFLFISPSPYKCAAHPD